MNLTTAKDLFLSGYFSVVGNGKTKSAYGADLSQFQEFAGPDRSLNSLTSSIVEEWASHLHRKGYAPASIKRKIVALKVFCSYWLRKAEISESPFWRIKLKFGRVEKLPRTLTGSEMRSLLLEAEKQSPVREPHRLRNRVDDGNCTDYHLYRRLRDTAIIDLMFATGIRVGELASLNINDYVASDATFKIRGKGGRERLAFAVDSTTLEIQKRHLAIRLAMATNDSALFLNSNGKRMSTQGISKALARLCGKAGIGRRVTPHMLRHTVATLLLRNGADIRVVQEFLGHSSIVTTQRYTHIAREHMLNALKCHHPSLDLRAGPGRI